MDLLFLMLKKLLKLFGRRGRCLADCNQYIIGFMGFYQRIIAMMKAFTKNEDVFKKRNILELYGTSLMIFFILRKHNHLFGEFGSIYGFYSSGEYVGELVVRSIKILITLITIFLTISTLYFLAPATQQRWKFISPGAVTAGILTLGAIIGLNYYFANVTNFNKLYGSLGAIILFNGLVYYISIVLLIGFELNAAIDMASYHHEKTKSPVEDNDSPFHWIADTKHAVGDAASASKTSSSGGGWRWHRRT